MKKYPVLNVVEPIKQSTSEVIDIPKDRLLSKYEIAALSTDNCISVRLSGSFAGNSFFIANGEYLKNYDFHLTVDDQGCLVVVPVKK
jgi:hypothetical protein